MYPEFILGLSATPYRGDGLGIALPMFIGRIQHVVDKKNLHKIGAVLKPVVRKIETRFRFRYRQNYPKMIKALVTSDERNKLIARTAHTDISKHNENIIMLSDRTSHCYEIQSILRTLGIESEVLIGSLSSSARKDLVNRLRAGQIKTVIATVSLVGEGFDLPELAM